MKIMGKRGLNKTPLAMLISAALTSPALLAADETSKSNELETIVVTSQKRQQSLKEVPVSVSAITADKMSDMGITDLSELSTFVPNFAVQKGSLGDTINIRGMQSGNNTGFEQSVGTFVNGVYRGRGPQSRFAFMDVERVEVLRGPQSILFGKNTVAGALNITTAKPTEDFTSTISASYNPEHKETEFTGMISGALSDTVNGRFFILNRAMDDGWIHNDYYDEGSPQHDELMGRLSLDWQASQNTNVSFIYEASDFESPVAQSIMKAGPLAAFGSKDNSWNNSNIGNEGTIFGFGSEQEMQGKHSEFTLISETEFDAGTLTAVIAKSDYDYTRFTDADYSALNGLRYDEFEEFEQTSVEVRFASKLTNDFEYITGLYYQTQELTTDNLSYFNLPVLQSVMAGGCALGVGLAGVDINDIFVPGNAIATGAGVIMNVPGATAGLVNSCGLGAQFVGAPAVGRYAELEQETETFAIFGQGTWHINEDFRATAGVRYTTEEKTGNQRAHASNLASAGDKAASTIPQMVGLAEAVAEFKTHAFAENDPGMDRSEDSPTWLVNIQYDVSDDTMAYTSASTGFKAGGFNAFYMASTDQNGQRYADSNDVSFEEEEVTSFEIGLKSTFLDNSADINISVFHTEFDDLQVSIFSGNTTFEVKNAAVATSQGIEIDGRWRITPDLTLYGSVGYLDFEYDDFKNQACTSEQFTQRRQELYAGSLSVGNVPGALGAALGYSNAMCAGEQINDLTGKTSEHSPEIQATLAATHYAEFGDYVLKSNLDINYQDETYRIADLDPVGLDDAVTLVNASFILSPSSDDWRLSLIINNITDQKRMSFINDIPMFAGTHGFLPQPGSNYTVKFQYHFE